MPQWSKKRRILLSKTSNNCADGEVYWWGVVNFHCVQMSLVLSVRFIIFGENWQGAKKVVCTAYHSGKLKLTVTSPNIITTSPKNVLMSRLISHFCNLNPSKNFICPSGKLRREFISPIAKSTSPRLLDTTFFAHWLKWCAMFILFFVLCGNDVISLESRSLIFVYLYKCTHSIQKKIVKHHIKSKYPEEYSNVNEVGSENFLVRKSCFM